MHRIHLALPTLDGEMMTLPAPQAHHVARVLRLRAGDVVAVFDGVGHEWQVQFTTVSPTVVQGRIVASHTVLPSTSPTLILGQALPKHGKMDLIVEKCSELGLTTLVPVYAARTVIRDVPARLQTRLARWRRIAAAAAQQCGRSTLLDVQPPQSFADFCTTYGTTPIKLVCWEGERQRGARHVLETLTEPGPCVVLVGPEGGLTACEVAHARAHGFVTMSLGPRMLRAETAAITITGLLRYRFGGLDPPGVSA